jgi:FlaA1/EpsC-like NDP-sugar epimerase
MKNWLRTDNLLLADITVILATVMASFAVRLDLAAWILDYVPTMLWMMLVGVIVKPLVFRRMGLYRRIWAYASTEELQLIVRAVTFSSLIVTAIIVGLYSIGWLWPLPRSVLVIDWLASIISIGGLRFSFRILADRGVGVGAHDDTARRILIAGAGDAGALVARELQKTPQLGLQPAAFVDDDADKHGLKIHGVPVVGTLDELPQHAKRLHIDEVIFAIPSAPGLVLRKVAEICRQAGISFRTMPGIYELIGGTVGINRLRKVDITDLLRRKPAEVDRDRVAANLRNKRVLVTGAGGSIASELCRYVARWSPRQLILLGHGENSIFEILVELRHDFPNLDIKPVIADVRDARRLADIWAQYQPDLVFHAAAHKHVPLMEMNVPESVTNNILGTRNVVTACVEHDVERLVMISTDKAVRPTSVMGATKRIAEWIVLDAAQRTGRPYSVVRFGNVLGSRGSVVPLFEQQIASGGPVTVTDPEMQRYFMTIPEAVHLVLQAATLDTDGRMYMLDMGEQIRIDDLAKDLIRLSGLEPGEDIEVVYTGLRPGDKLKEELHDPGEGYEITEHPDVMRVLERDRLSGDELAQLVDSMAAMAQEGDSEGLLAQLNRVVPGAQTKA